MNPHDDAGFPPSGDATFDEAFARGVEDGRRAALSEQHEAGERRLDEVAKRPARGS